MLKKAMIVNYAMPHAHLNMQQFSAASYVVISHQLAKQNFVIKDKSYIAAYELTHAPPRSPPYFS